MYIHICMVDQLAYCMQINCIRSTCMQMSATVTIKCYRYYTAKQSIMPGLAVNVLLIYKH